VRELVLSAGFEVAGEIETFRRVGDHKKLFTGLMLVRCTNPGAALR
jgi:hypothetical protein